MGLSWRHPSSPTHSKPANIHHRPFIPFLPRSRCSHGGCKTSGFLITYPARWSDRMERSDKFFLNEEPPGAIGRVRQTLYGLVKSWRVRSLPILLEVRSQERPVADGIPGIGLSAPIPRPGGATDQDGSSIRFRAFKQDAVPMRRSQALLDCRLARDPRLSGISLCRPAGRGGPGFSAGSSRAPNLGTSRLPWEQQGSDRWPRIRKLLGRLRGSGSGPETTSEASTHAGVDGPARSGRKSPAERAGQRGGPGGGNIGSGIAIRRTVLAACARPGGRFPGTSGPGRSGGRSVPLWVRASHRRSRS